MISALFSLRFGFCWVSPKPPSAVLSGLESFAMWPYDLSGYLLKHGVESTPVRAMGKIRAHHVRITTFIHATEDEDKVLGK